MNTPEITAQKSLEFLENRLISEQQIASASSLPFARDVMEKALLGYIPVLIKSGMEIADVKMRMHLICAALANHVQESDAKFVETIEKTLEVLRLKWMSRGPVKIDEATKGLYINKGGAESEIDHYLKILDKVEAERARLTATVDAALQNVISESLK